MEIQKQMEAQIRKDAEGAFHEAMESMIPAREEAKNKLEKARIEANDALMRIEAEPKAEEERAWKHGEAMKKAEEKAPLRFEAGEAVAKAAEEATAKAKAEAVDLNKKIEEETKAKIADAAEQAPIKLKDAVGRKFSFPFHLCSTWQVRKTNSEPLPVCF